MPEPYADRVWLNGRFLTLDSALPHCTALAERGGRIAAIGSDDEIRALCGPETTAIDLRGAFVYPGFIEGHMHLSAYGDSLMTLQTRDRSKEAILAAVREAAKATPAGTWIRGGMGFNNEVWADPSYPTLEELDAVSPDHPVCLPRMDGHLIWCNSRAYALAGVGADTPNPDDGEFMRKPDGSLQGCASDGAAKRVQACIPPRTAKERQAALLKAQEQLLKFGVTSLNDMATSITDVEDIKALCACGQYRIRFHGALQNALGDGAPASMKAYLRQCPEIGLYDGRYTMRACKLLGDGAVGAQSASLKDDYTDRPGHRGVKMHTDEELYALVSEAAAQGMQMIIHAIGDDTIDQVIRVYGRVLHDHPTPDHRWHIEHFQTVYGDQCERARALGIWVSMQPLHAPNSASMALRRLGPVRSSRAYAGGMLLRAMGEISWGSDAPVATPSPLSGIHAAITRTNDQLLPEGGFFPENAVSPMEALLGYTLWGAKAQFTEKDKGSLAPGKYADFVVLNRDLLSVAVKSPDDVLSIRVLRTVIGGETVYEA